MARHWVSADDAAHEPNPAHRCTAPDRSDAPRGSCRRSTADRSSPRRMARDRRRRTRAARSDRGRGRALAGAVDRAEVCCSGRRCRDGLHRRRSSAPDDTCHRSGRGAPRPAPRRPGSSRCRCVAAPVVARVRAHRRHRRGGCCRVAAATLAASLLGRWNGGGCVAGSVRRSSTDSCPGGTPRGCRRRRADGLPRPCSCADARGHRSGRSRTRGAGWREGWSWHADGTRRNRWIAAVGGSGRRCAVRGGDGRRSPPHMLTHVGRRSPRSPCSRFPHRPGRRRHRSHPLVHSARRSAGRVGSPRNVVGGWAVAKVRSAPAHHAIPPRGRRAGGQRGGAAVARAIRRAGVGTPCWADRAGDVVLGAAHLPNRAEGGRHDRLGGRRHRCRVADTRWGLVTRGRRPVVCRLLRLLGAPHSGTRHRRWLRRTRHRRAGAGRRQVGVARRTAGRCDLDLRHGPGGHAASTPP